MTNYFTYNPTPINLSTNTTFNLTYNSEEILDPNVSYALQNISNNEINTFNPITIFAEGIGLLNGCGLVFDTNNNLYVLNSNYGTMIKFSSSGVMTAI
jgi:hypothetical protein